MTGRASFVCLAVALAAGAPARAQDAPTFRSSTEVVRVDVLATVDGRPVRGLGPGDFEVTDSGVAQVVDLVSFEQLPLNVVLAFDLSESVSGERLAHLTAASRAVLARLERSDQVALVSFSHVVAPGAGLTTDASTIARALEDAVPGGETSLVDATYTALLVGESDVGRSLVIVFSDGVDTAGCRPKRVLDIAKRTDAVVYSVAVRSVAVSPFLREMAEQTGGRQFTVDSTRDLGAAFEGILDEFRRRYVIGFTPRGVPAGSWHRWWCASRDSVRRRARGRGTSPAAGSVRPCRPHGAGARAARYMPRRMRDPSNFISNL